MIWIVQHVAVSLRQRNIKTKNKIINMGNEEKKFLSYRNAYKSDHLAGSDIEEMVENSGKAILTLDKIEQLYNYTVAGRRLDVVNIATFKEKGVKPMVVNSKKGDIIAAFLKDRNIYNWVNLDLKIELYFDPSVKMKGVKVGGIGIKKIYPKEAKKTALSDIGFNKLLKAISEGSYTIVEAKETFSLTEDQLKQLK